ncbi:MAG: SDR family NAD(P)-dependent oxidoreductase, partial [Solirubrobacteraceae bacterium]
MSLPAPSPDTAALVTGASSGIGAAIARELAERGHGLVLVARRKDRLDALAEELSGEFGVRAEAVGCDLGKAASRQRLPARIGSLGLEVNVLVNNAGFATNGAFHESDSARELE